MKTILLCTFLFAAISEADETLLAWLPENTQTVIVVNDLRQAIETYQSAGHADFPSSFQERFAMEPSEVADLSLGKFLRAELVETDGSVTEVAVTQVGAAINTEINKIHGRLKQQRARVIAKAFGALEGTVITRQRNDGSEYTSVHIIHAGHLYLINSPDAANALAAHIATVEGKSLVGQKKFQQVWEKCSVELKGESLALAWYADPWLGIRIRKQENENKDYLFADRHGMTGIVALGGSVVFGDADEQSVKAFAHVPKPLVSSLQMVEQLSGADDLTLPTWVSKAATDIVVLHGSVDKALKHAGRMFDDGFADGVDGTYDEVLSDLKEALDLDLQQELYPLLGPQVYLVHGAAEHRDWQPLVVAFEVKDAARVAEILSALIADDPEASEVVLTRDTDRVWHVPGKRGARDFVLGMLNGVAVYANDLDFAKAALRFDESEALLSREQLLRLRDRAVKDVAGRPSLLIVRNPNSDEPTSTAHPLGLVFEGTQFFADREAHDVGSMQWLPRRLTMMLARHDLVVGFNDEDGWEFAARSGGQLEVSQDDR